MTKNVDNLFAKIKFSPNAGSCEVNNTFTNEFEALGCLIKSIDTNFKSIVNLTLRCDLLNLKDLQKRRDEIIEDI